VPAAGPAAVRIEPAPRRTTFHDATSSENHYLRSQSHDVDEVVAAAVSQAIPVAIELLFANRVSLPDHKVDGGTVGVRAGDGER
jgi:hypothetical protein